MSVDNFKPEIWNAGLLSILAKSLVYGANANHNYEGDISNYGDTVHITSVDDVSIGDYTPNQDLADAELLNTTQQTLTIDQGKTFHFYVDDVDARQVRNDGALMSEAASRAAFNLRDVVDQFVAGKMIGAAGSVLDQVDASTTKTNLYDELLVPAAVALDEKNVPTGGRWIVLSPAAYGVLQLDSRFIKQNESGSNALHNGVVGEAAGFTIYKSNNAPKTDGGSVTASAASGDSALVSTTAGAFDGMLGAAVSGTGVASGSYITSVSSDGKTANLNLATTAAVTSVTVKAGAIAVAGTNIATTFANQILETTAYRPEKRFGDAVKGLHVYGGMVVRPEALVVGQVKTSA